MSNRRRVRPMPSADRLKALADAVDLTFAPNHEPSSWLRKAIGDLRARMLAGHLTVCPHLRPGMVALTALWAADQMVCSACLSMLAVVGDDDRRCDRCSVVARADQIHPAMTSLDPSGAVLVLLGLCTDCSRREVAA